MKKNTLYKKGCLLFHSSHGLCRIKEINKQIQSWKEQYYYSLESREARFKRAKFIIDASQINTSGFHLVISREEANKILNYLKTNDLSNENQNIQELSKEVLSLIEKNTPWAFSKVILIYSREKNGQVAKGKREMLLRAVKGLMRELSFVLNLSEREVCQKVKKNLVYRSKANQWVLDAVLGTVQTSAMGPS